MKDSDFYESCMNNFIYYSWGQQWLSDCWYDSLNLWPHLHSAWNTEKNYKADPDTFRQFLRMFWSVWLLINRTQIILRGQWTEGLPRNPQLLASIITPALAIKMFWFSDKSRVQLSFPLWIWNRLSNVSSSVLFICSVCILSIEWKICIGLQHVSHDVVLLVIYSLSKDSCLCINDKVKLKNLHLHIGIINYLFNTWLFFVGC